MNQHGKVKTNKIRENQWRNSNDWKLGLDTLKEKIDNFDEQMTNV